MSSASILPRQSTALELAIDEAMPAWGDLTNAMHGSAAGPVGSVPAVLHPWLAAEWGVADFAAYFDSTSDLLNAAIPWLLERGTAAGVRRVLGWLGYDQVAIEEDGPYLHIDLGHSATPTQIDEIARVVRHTIPAHVRFYRVFHAYDLRPLRLDGGQPMDCALLDNDSGVWVLTDTGEPVKASFAQAHTALVDSWQAAPFALGYTATHASTLPHSDRLQLDTWRLDSFLVVDSYAGMGAMVTGRCDAPAIGNPVGYAALHYGHTQIGIADWKAQATVGTQTAQHTSLLTSPMPTRRGWSGTWDATPWRPSIDSKHSQD